ncbi:MAG: 3-hydroxy-3-methylglutaryl CoA synthase [Chloroflexi bacterium]|nr:3-hydroxy-3-methylglutaryl CoA synthase [Chloroflexota bacterium]
MAGIVSFGGYVPRYRLNRGAIVQAMSWMNIAIMAHAQGEKAVANYDEDPITMAVAAGIDALKGIDRSTVEGVYFASTTMPYNERLNAGIIIPALNVKDQVRAADFSGGLKAGTTALLSALDAVRAGSLNNIVVTSADCRLAKAATNQEMIFGDAAAAFVVGNKDVIAEFKGSYSVTYDFCDHIRTNDSEVDRQWEERWIRDMGYSQFIPEAIGGLLEKYQLKMADFAKVIYPCNNRGARKDINKKLGITSAMEQSALQAEIGDSGTSLPLVMLAQALETAKPGDKLLVASYGSGVDALYFEVTKNIHKKTGRLGVSGYLAKKHDLGSYTKYLVWRDLLPADVGMRNEVADYTAFSMLWRRRKDVLGLWGTRCTSCGTPQWPPQRICANPECGAVDKTEPYSFADKTGRIISFTGDMLAAGLNPPSLGGRLEFEGGGRNMFDFTDCTLEELSTGKAMTMTFRLKYNDRARSIIGYYWKAMPAQEVK